MPNYFLVTEVQVLSLGFFVSNGEAEDYAMQKFNIDQDRVGYIVVNDKGLKNLSRISEKLLDEKNNIRRSYDR